MAKGLRSKSMRKNRAILRATVIEPVLRKQQEKLNEALRQSIDQKKTSSLLAIKKAVTKGRVVKKVAKAATKTEVGEDKSSKKYSQVTGLKDHKTSSKGHVGKAYKASRSQPAEATQTKNKGSKKELFWF